MFVVELARRIASWRGRVGPSLADLSSHGWLVGWGVTQRGAAGGRAGPVSRSEFVEEEARWHRRQGGAAVGCVPLHPALAPAEPETLTLTSEGETGGGQRSNVYGLGARMPRCKAHGLRLCHEPLFGNGTGVDKIGVETVQRWVTVLCLSTGLRRALSIERSQLPSPQLVCTTP